MALGTFQKTINADPAYAVEGDFYGANPRATRVPPIVGGANIAGAAGVTVGRFAWVDATTGQVSNQNPGTANAQIGFVSRTGQTPALITAWLSSASLVVQSGLEITLHNTGDFWGRFSASLGNAGGATIGQKVYASYNDGSLLAGAAATPITETITASLAAAVMTVTVAGTYPLAPGMPVSGTGIAAGSYIMNQLTGTPGGLGTYTLSASETTESAETVTVTLNYETSFYVEQTCAAGELAVISTRI